MISWSISIELGLELATLDSAIKRAKMYRYSLEPGLDLIWDYTKKKKKKNNPVVWFKNFYIIEPEIIGYFAGLGKLVGILLQDRSNRI